MFRPLQDHRRGGIYKGIQIKQILSQMCVSGEVQYCLVKYSIVW